MTYLGAGGERTDVISHVTGFLVGLGMGILYTRLGAMIPFRRIVQLGLGAATLVLLALSWMLALM